MAKRVEERIFGIDVSKKTLDIADEHRTVQLQIGNDEKAIAAWISQQTGPMAIALEATNNYHELVLALLVKANHPVYLVDGYRVSKYREATGGRAKTDACDAVLLARYLRTERAHLRLAKPLTDCQRRFFSLLRHRACMTRAIAAMRQSANSLSIDDPEHRAWLKGGDAGKRRIDRQLIQLSKKLGWGHDISRCQSTPGIGILNALALTGLLRRGDFSHADAFIAFIGLDVRVRESGTFRGRAKLTKKGDGEIRRLLYNAAMAARRDPRWKVYYERQLAKGLSSTGALMALARKLVRICFALVKNQTTYDHKLAGWTCQVT